MYRFCQPQYAQPAGRQHRVALKGTVFYWPAHANPNTWDGIRVPGSDPDTRRSIDEICLEELERLYVDVLRWHDLVVDVSACESLVAAVRTVERKLTQFLNDASGSLTYAMAA